MTLTSIKWFILLAFLIINADAKYFSTSISVNQFSKEGWKYLTKFGMEIGSGAYKMRVKLNKALTDNAEHIQLYNLVYYDDKWEEALSRENCNDKQGLSSVKKLIEVPLNGEWSEWGVQELSQVVKKRVWFWVLSDCDKLTQSPSLYGYKLEIEIKILNSDESQFSCEENGLLKIQWFIFFGTVGFFFFNAVKFWKMYQKEEDWDWAYFGVILALLFQIGSLFFECIHMSIYASNGKGLFLLQLIGQLFFITAQFTVTVLLILIAWGWTINYLDLEDFDIYIPLIILLGVIHTMIIGISKLTDDSYYKYHIYDGYTGLIIILLRLGMFAYFLLGLIKTYKKARLLIRNFIVKFGIYSSIYLLTVPILVIIAYFAAPYVRNKIVQIGSLLIMILSQFMLSYTFTSKKSSYHDASIRNRSKLPIGKDE